MAQEATDEDVMAALNAAEEGEEEAAEGEEEQVEGEAEEAAEGEAAGEAEQGEEAVAEGEAPAEAEAEAEDIEEKQPEVVTKDMRTTCSAAVFSALGSASMLSSSSLLTQLANSLSCALSPTEAEAAEAVAAVKEEEAREAEAEGCAPAPPPEPELDPEQQERYESLAAALSGVRILSGSGDRTLRVWDPSRLAEGGSALRATLEGHSNWVHSVCDLGNGMCASGSDDCSVRVWSLGPGGGSTLHIMKGHTGYVTALVCLDGGEKLLSASDDTTLRIWSTGDGACLQTLQGHTGDVTCAADVGWDLLVSGSRDKTLRVWQMPQATCVQKLRGHTNTVYACAAILPSASGAARAASSSADHLVCIWNVVAGTCERVLEGHGSTVHALACLSDAHGSLVSGCQAGRLIVWRPDDEYAQPIELLGHTDAVLSLAGLPGGRVVSGSQDGTMRVWHPAEKSCEAVLSGHSNWVLGVAALHPEPLLPRGVGRQESSSDDDSD